MGSPQGPDGHPLVLLCGAPELGSDLCIFSPCSILARQGGKMGPPRFSSAHSTSPSPRKASTITGQALKRNKRCWMGGAAPPKTRSAWTGAVAKEMYLQTRCQDYFTAMSCFCFPHRTTICITEKSFLPAYQDFFVKSSLVLKRTGTTLFFHKLVGFGELESWLRPAPTSCLCQQPLSLHSFSQGTKPSHTESTSWTAPENLKSIGLNRILLGDVSVTRRK